MLSPMSDGLRAALGAHEAFLRLDLGAPLDVVAASLGDVSTALRCLPAAEYSTFLRVTDHARVRACLERDERPDYDRALGLVASA